MKRLWSLTLLSFFFFGCTTQKLQEPVAFHYPSADYIHSLDGSLLDSELRETEGMESTQSILDLYLSGPQSAHLANPFPAGCRLTAIELLEDAVILTISDELAQLTGISLSLACASLSVTCMELTGAQTVQIRAQTQLLDGDEEIVMTKDTLHISGGNFADAEENQES